MMRRLLPLLLVLACGTASAASDRSDQVRQCGLLGGAPTERAFLVCLVDRFHWGTDSAAAFVRDTVRQMEVEYARRAKIVQDSMDYRDSVTAAMERESDSLDQVTRVALGRAAEERRLARLWVFADGGDFYYKGTCAAARKIVGDVRHEVYDEPTPNSGYKRSTDPGC